MAHCTLPPYSPSLSSPRYSNEPLPGERTIEFARRSSSLPLIGVHRRVTDHFTITLRNQPPGGVCPTYDRGGLIQGDVILNHAANVASVILKLKGRFLLRGSEASASSVFLSETHVLWNISDPQRCPLTIPFVVALPFTFKDGDQVRPLPPTIDSREAHATCSYSLTIELSRPRQFISFLKGNIGVKIPFIYRHKCRPHLPMLASNLTFMSTLKCSPEEWHEVTFTLPMSQGSGLERAECLLFIPSVQTYAFSDTIPFHLQIRGNPFTLIHFLEQDQDGSQGEIERRNRGVIIRVYLLRQISIRISGQSATAYCNIGDGEIEPSHSSPLKHHTFLPQPLGEGLDCLDWSGVLRCDKDVDVPSFFTSQFAARDSITISITPRQPLKSPVIGGKYSCPIRLATDPYQAIT